MGRPRQPQQDGLITGLIYTRVSGDEQAKKGLSLPAQLQACRRYAAERGWLIAGEYQDVLSGKRDDRTGYQQVLEQARALTGQGRRVAVVVMRLDRLGRRLPERIRSREELKALGVETHSIREGGHVNDMVAGFLAVLAEEEVERLGDRVRDTREHNQANGWHLPGRVPWGYRWRPATAEERRQGAPKSVLEPDPATAPYVREVFRLVASGEMTARGVALWVARLPDGARGPAGQSDQRVRVLNPSRIRQVLLAPVYAGRFPDGSPGRWEPLVDAATWEAVRAVMDARRAVRGPVSGGHLLTSMLRCPACGGRMAGQVVGKEYPRYRCSSTVLGGESTRRGCQVTATAPAVNRDVLAQVSALLAPLATSDPELRRAIGRAWERLRKPDDAAARTRARLVAQARKDADDARRRIADAARLLVDGVLDATAYRALAEAEQKRLEAAEAVLTAPEIAAMARDALPPLQDVLRLLGGWQAVLTDGTVPEQRDLLLALVERVVPVRIGHGRYTAEITWTALGKALGAMARHAA